MFGDTIGDWRVKNKNRDTRTKKLKEQETVGNLWLVSWKKNDNSFHGYQHETQEHMPIVQYLDRQTHLSPRSIIRSIFISYHRYGYYFDYTSCQQKFYTCYRHQHHHHSPLLYIVPTLLTSTKICLAPLHFVWYKTQ